MPGKVGTLPAFPSSWPQQCPSWAKRTPYRTPIRMTTPARFLARTAPMRTLRRFLGRTDALEHACPLFGQNGRPSGRLPASWAERTPLSTPARFLGRTDALQDACPLPSPPDRPCGDSRPPWTGAFRLPTLPEHCVIPYDICAACHRMHLFRIRFRGVATPERFPDAAPLLRFGDRPPPNRGHRTELARRTVHLKMRCNLLNLTFHFFGRALKKPRPQFFLLLLLALLGLFRAFVRSMPEENHLRHTTPNRPSTSFTRSTRSSKHTAFL